MARIESLVVADAGPIIHLDELGALDVLSDFQQILVAQAVWQEVEHHRPQALHNKAIHWVRVDTKNCSEVEALARIYTLHHGEKQALSVCVSHELPRLLSDDTAARLAAKALNIQSYGTLGLLIRSVRKEHRTQQEVLSLLSQIPKRTTLHIKPSLLQSIIQKLQQEWR
ncbi:MAG: hypothetical protein AB7D03_04405 [Thiomicrospira sp.]